MKFGLILPNRGKPYGDVHLLLDLALLAEESDRDGWFIRDHIGGGGDSPCSDLWICLLGRTAVKNLKADRAAVKSYVTTGLTGYLEAIHSGRGSIKQVRERIKIGSPH